MKTPSSYFTIKEFTCKCGCGITKADYKLINILNIIREAIGQPITITSGYRCPSHNKKVGGVVNSNHTKGYAADIQCKNRSSENMHEVILNLYRLGKLPNLAGLGLYDTFVHVDIFPKLPMRLRRWDERKNKKN